MEPLAPMRLYTLSKRHFVLVFVVFFVCFGLTVFIGIAGPNVIETSVARTDLNNSLKKCSEIIVVHLGYLNYTQYNIFVSFEDLNKLTYIQNITFTWKTYNPTFSQVEIWFRFVFVVLTFMVTGERKCLTFYLPKFFIVGLLWLASVTLGIWQTVNEVHDPTYQYRVDTGNFQGMKIFFLVVATTYVLYLLFLIVRACSELRNMPYVDLRLKFLTALTFVVLVIRITYGHADKLDSETESQLKDNPAFSMLNDSDDDVIYGSDYEEMPLQNGQAIRAKYKEESDSD
ncbi:hypothetical protein AAES_124201 [Amazona aestiva]|uniref:Transmembrane protein 181 n=1 Tax=Amazona aestiva TaxID=12930 RepID=A0A0Q3MBF6_AMAAE|nr:hypothetical protein AAES_124201 [Amazona aestiva]